MTAFSFQQTVNTPAQPFFGVSTGFSRFFKGKLGVCAEGQQLFTALEAILQAPAFRAARSDEKKEAVAVKEFLGLVCGLYATNSGICERHGGITPGKEFCTPRNTPNEWGVYGFFQPSPDKSFRKFPCQEALSGLRRDWLNENLAEMEDLKIYYNYWICFIILCLKNIATRKVTRAKFFQIFWYTQRTRRNFTGELRTQLKS